METGKKDHKIYKYTNRVNGKVYIGRTCQTLEKRARYNGSGYKECPHFWNAIKKHGWNNFYVEILEEGLTDLEASAMELFYIKKYDSSNKDKGYNICDDESCHEYRTYKDSTRRKLSIASTNQKVSEETKKKISLKNKGKKLTEEHRKKISESNKGKVTSEQTRKKISENHADISGDKNPMWGKTHSKDARDKMRKARLGKKLSKEQCAKVQKALKGKVPWNKGRKLTEEQKRKYKGRRNGARKVICEETGVTYLTIKDAASSVNVTRTAIVSAIERKGQSGGYHWHYVKD